GLAAAGLIGAFLALLVGGIGWTIRDRAAQKEEVDRERAARVGAMEGKAILALNDADALRERAMWSDALGAVKGVEGFVAAGGSEALRARVRETRKDLEMVLRLEQIRMSGPRRGRTGEDEAFRDAAYARAFRDFGIDMDAVKIGEAAERIRARSVWLELTAALDVWADNRRVSRKAEDTSWRRLFAIARVADPDPWRNQVRTALEQGDQKTLNQLATSAIVRELPVQSPRLLVYRGHVDFALEKSMLRQAQREHPDNYELNFQLAWGSGPEEAIRFYSAALAAHPKNAKVRFFLGYALWCRGKRDEALAEFH